MLILNAHKHTKYRISTLLFFSCTQKIQYSKSVENENAWSHILYIPLTYWEKYFSMIINQTFSLKKSYCTAYL
jgi:hypothetical protein